MLSPAGGWTAIGVGPAASSVALTDEDMTANGVTNDASAASASLAIARDDRAGVDADAIT
jgi:hypothetical protein